VAIALLAVQVQELKTVVQKGIDAAGDPVLVPPGHVVKLSPKLKPEPVEEKGLNFEKDVPILKPGTHPYNTSLWRLGTPSLDIKIDPNTPYAHLEYRYELMLKLLQGNRDRALKKVEEDEDFEDLKESDREAIREKLGVECDQFCRLGAKELFATVDPPLITITDSAAKYLEIVKCNNPSKGLRYWRFGIVVLKKTTNRNTLFVFKAYDSSGVVLDGGNFSPDGAYYASKGDKVKGTADLRDSALWRVSRITIYIR